MSGNQIVYYLKLTSSRLAALIVPAAYHTAQSHTIGDPSHPRDEPLSGLLAISRGTSVILLIVYAFYLWFQLRTHAGLFQAAQSEEDEPERSKMGTAAACLAYVPEVFKASSDAYVS